MNSIYKYEEPKDFKWDNMFLIESDEYKKACGILGAKTVKTTPEMERFIPEPNELFSDC